MKNIVFTQCGHIATPKSNGLYAYDYNGKIRVLYLIDGKVEDLLHNNKECLIYKKDKTFDELPKWCKNHLMKYNTPTSKITD